VHIALTADPELPVPPGLYGGIERMIFALATGLVERGHQVRLFANRDSKVPCALHPYPADRSRGGLAVLRNTWHVSAGVLGKGVDIVHSFGRLAYIAPLLPVGVPVLMSYQRPITARWIGSVVRTRLRLRTVRRHGVFIVPMEELPKLLSLYEKYGLGREEREERGAAAA